MKVLRCGGAWRLSARTAADQAALNRLHEAQNPPQTSRFIGRTHELEKLRSYFANGFRVCTIVGAAGAGKISCAIEATYTLSKTFPDGIIFIDLTRINCSRELTSAITSAAGLRQTMSSQEATLQALSLRFIGTRTLLLLADLARRRGDQWSYAHTLNGLGDLFSARGSFERSKTDYKLSLHMFHELDDRWLIAWCEEGLGLTEFRQKNFVAALEHTARALSLFNELGDQMNVAVMMLRTADIQCNLSQTEIAAMLAGGASRIIDSLGTSDEGRSPRIENARSRCKYYENRWRLEWAAGRNSPQHELIRRITQFDI